jgi:hypothetical protein
MQKTNPANVQDTDEISLADIIYFLNRNRKFIALTTLGLSLLAISLFLIKPKPIQYQKQITLSVRPAPELISDFPVMDVNQANTTAVKFLQNLKLDQTTIQPQYDATTQQIDLTLRSPNSSALTNAEPKIINQLKTSFGKILSNSIEASLTSKEMAIKRCQRILEQLQQQSSQFSPTNEFRIGAVEEERVQQLAHIAQLEFDKQYLKQGQKNLVDFTSQAISIQVLAESDKPPQSRSLVAILVIAIIASFMVSVFAAIIRDQVLRLKTELSEQKPQSSPDA